MTLISKFNKLPTITSSDAKNGFAEVLERVSYRVENVVVTRSAKPAAMVVPVDDTPGCLMRPPAR